MLALGLATADLGAIPAGIFERHGLSHTHYNVLRMLRGAGDGGLTYSEIRDRMIMGVPDVTRLMDRLEERGLIRRHRDDSDRRRVIHSLTSEGLDVLRAIQPRLDAFHGWLSSQLSRSALKTLVGTCEQLIASAARAGSTAEADNAAVS